MAVAGTALSEQHARPSRRRILTLPSRLLNRTTLLVRFTLVSLSVTVLISVGFSWLLSRRMIDQALDDAATEAAKGVTTLLTPLVTPEDFGSPTAARVAAWRQRAARVVGGMDIVRVKIWDAHGQVIYSDDQKLIGRSYPLEDQDELREALEGHVAKELSSLAKSENVDERTYGRLLEIYVPVVLPSSPRVVGAYEIYRNFTPLQVRIAAIKQLVWGGSIVAFGLLYASLFVVVSSASRQLSRLASFPQLHPNPVIETDLAGNVTYLNPAGVRLFPDIRRVGLHHPMLSDLKSVIADLPTATERSFVREIKVDDITYQQVVSYIQASGLVRIYALDVTEQKRAQEEIQRQLQRLSALRAIHLAIAGSLDLRVTLSVVLDQVTTQLHVDAADILLLNSETRTLEYAAGRGFRTTALQHSRLRLGQGHAGRAADERRLIVVPSLQEDPGDFARAPLLATEGFVPYYAAPLIAKGQVRGVLEVFHRARPNADQQWLDFLEALAGQAAIAIDDSMLFMDLERANSDLTRAYDATLEGWARALDLREKETERHSERVTELALRLARAVGMRGDELVHVRRGALLHDIGKIAIPDSILLKPGPLTEEEWKIMRRHPVYAYELLAPIPYLRPALDIPYCHHEKWNGTGYPRGLRGDQVPLAARIFAVADVWDGLRSDRPYRAAWADEKARHFILEQAGEHFDPEVVQTFSSLGL